VGSTQRGRLSLSVPHEYYTVPAKADDPVHDTAQDLRAETHTQRYRKLLRVRIERRNDLTGIRDATKLLKCTIGRSRDYTCCAGNTFGLLEKTVQGGQTRPSTPPGGKGCKADARGRGLRFRLTWKLQSLAIREQRQISEALRSGVAAIQSAGTCRTAATCAVSS
jgi:hypothetical protein